MIEAAEILEADRKTVNRFWGQALQKRACGCREGKALRLHPLPILTLFHRFRNVPVHIVPRSGTQNIVQKEKVAVSGVL